MMRASIPGVLLLFALMLLSIPTAGEAQLRVGVHAVHAEKSFGGSTGLGLRTGIQLPVIPFDLFASGEYFFPDCPAGQDNCGLHGVSLDGNFRFVFPIVRPYLSGGLVHRRIDSGGVNGSTSDTGISVGAGVDLRLGSLGAFAEGRYEFVDAPNSQAILRAGVLLGLF